MNSEISFPTNLSASLENPLLQQREPVQITTDLGNLERSCGETIDNKGSVATTTKELSHYVAEEVKVTTTESTEEEPITLYDRELADAERNIPPNKIEELEVFYLLKELHFNGRNREEARRLLQQLERFPDLKVLNLAGCSDITDEEVRCIERISTLKELNLTNCTHISTECIINVLNANSGIQRLLLGGNKNLNAQELKKIFEGDRNFKYVDFQNCTQFEKLNLCDMADIFSNHEFYYFSPEKDAAFLLKCLDKKSIDLFDLIDQTGYSTLRKLIEALEHLCKRDKTDRLREKAKKLTFFIKKQCINWSLQQQKSTEALLEIQRLIEKLCIAFTDKPTATFLPKKPISPLEGLLKFFREI